MKDKPSKIRVPKIVLELKKLKPKFFENYHLTLAVHKDSKFWVRIRDMAHKGVFNGYVKDSSDKDIAKFVAGKVKGKK